MMKRTAGKRTGHIRRSLWAVLACCALLASLMSGCNAQTRYEKTWVTLFDTVITAAIYAPNEKTAAAHFDALYAELFELDALYDIYEPRPDAAGLWAINAGAGAPVAADARVVGLLSFAKEAYELTSGTVNVLMGSVLALWHDARTAAAETGIAALPDSAALAEAAKHTDIGGLVIDEEAGTVTLEDPLSSIDAGAVAKGYAADLAAELLRQRGVERALLSLGGNICCIGEKPGGEKWSIAVQDPFDAAASLGTVGISDCSLVTSGAYQRYFEIDGVRYNHIIDPSTLMPANRFSAVTVRAQSSAMGDALSTALFILPYEDGLAALECAGAGALWVWPDEMLNTYHIDMD